MRGARERSLPTLFTVDRSGSWSQVQVPYTVIGFIYSTLLALTVLAWKAVL